METILLVSRFKTTKDAYFGKVTLDGDFVCYSMERIAVAIPEGTYAAEKALSPHFNRLTPHLTVPNRTYIEIHPANWPSQLEGCIAVGTSIDGDALDQSVVAFDALMALLPPNLTVTVCTA